MKSKFLIPILIVSSACHSAETEDPFRKDCSPLLKTIDVPFRAQSWRNDVLNKLREYAEGLQHTFDGDIEEALNRMVERGQISAREADFLNKIGDKHHVILESVMTLPNVRSRMAETPAFLHELRHLMMNLRLGPKLSLIRAHRLSREGLDTQTRLISDRALYFFAAGSVIKGWMIPVFEIQNASHEQAWRLARDLPSARRSLAFFERRLSVKNPLYGRQGIQHLATLETLREIVDIGDAVQEFERFMAYVNKRIHSQPH